MMSTLNPNAPIFVPSAYRDVEDFSDQWWSLVDSSPWFRDYWLRECFTDPQIYDPAISDIDDLFVDEVSGDDFDAGKVDEEKEGEKELISLGLLKWHKPRPVTERPKYGQKAPKIVNVKMSPRPIQQPR